MKRPIAISLSPNTEKDDVSLAFKTLFSPTEWFNETSTVNLEIQFSRRFGKDYKSVAVNSGRSALYMILKILGIEKGDEVCLQALTCVAVPNAVLWLGAKPVYIDVDKSFNMDPEDLRRKISKHVKAIIVQHSFGIPANMKEIIKIAGDNGIAVIEDCALSLGASYDGKEVGTLGDISFFSFGRDKVISSVFGGMILCRDDEIHNKLLRERNKLSFPGKSWVIQQLLHPILFSLILPVYNFGLGKFTLGKLMLFLFQSIGLMSKAIYDEEKEGHRPRIFPAKLPGALSVLALNQIKKINNFNKHRQEIADIYFRLMENSEFTIPPKNKGAIWVRFPVYGPKAVKIYETAKNKGILLGDWYKRVVEPVSDLSLVSYRVGSCPQAEKYSGNMLNLPTYPSFTIHEAKKLNQFFK